MMRASRAAFVFTLVFAASCTNARGTDQRVRAPCNEGMEDGCARAAQGTEMLQHRKGAKTSMVNLDEQGAEGMQLKAPDTLHIILMTFPLSPSLVQGTTDGNSKAIRQVTNMTIRVLDDTCNREEVVASLKGSLDDEVQDACCKGSLDGEEIELCLPCAMAEGMTFTVEMAPPDLGQPELVRFPMPQIDKVCDKSGSFLVARVDEKPGSDGFSLAAAQIEQVLGERGKGVSLIITGSAAEYADQLSTRAGRDQERSQGFMLVYEKGYCGGLGRTLSRDTSGGLTSNSTDFDWDAKDLSKAQRACDKLMGRTGGFRNDPSAPKLKSWVGGVSSSRYADWASQEK